MNDPTKSFRPADSGARPDVPDLELIRPIGAGGFGQVWLATNRTTGHLRAVKLVPLRRAGTADPAGREITSLTRLQSHLGSQHPNLLTIHHIGQTSDHLFYVMDVADDLSGEPASRENSYRPATLQTRLDSSTPAPDECLCYARQLLAGLASLHDAGMVHRDVKPANCLFIGGALKLADFGLLVEAGPHVSRVGTLKYMPPDGHMDMRADVYAAGLVIYEMVTGLPADSFPRLGARAAEVARSPILCRLVRVSLAACRRDPNERYANAGQMAGELAATDFRAPSVGLRKRHLIGATAALAVLFAVAGIGTWTTRSVPVDVNFITYPFEATVYVDGRQLMRADGSPYTTPCTVEDVPPSVHRVVFRHEDFDEDLQAGEFDFAAIRQVVGRWGSD